MFGWKRVNHLYIQRYYAKNLLDRYQIGLFFTTHVHASMLSVGQRIYKYTNQMKHRNKRYNTNPLLTNPHLSERGICII